MTHKHLKGQALADAYANQEATMTERAKKIGEREIAAELIRTGGIYSGSGQFIPTCGDMPEQDESSIRYELEGETLTLWDNGGSRWSGPAALALARLRALPDDNGEDGWQRVWDAFPARRTP